MLKWKQEVKQIQELNHFNIQIWSNKNHLVSSIVPFLSLTSSLNSIKNTPFPSLGISNPVKCL